MAILLSEPTELIGVIEPLRVAGNFLSALLFSAAPITFDTDEIKWDRVFDDLRIAPYVSPYSPGHIMQDKGFQTESFSPGYMKPKNRVTPKEFNKRRPGEPIGGAYSLQQRHDLYIVDKLAEHKKQIKRREEIQAASIALTGRVVIVGDEYPSTTVDFSRDGTMTKVLTSGARWLQAGVSPIDDFDGWCDEQASLTGAAPSVGLFDKLAWTAFAADPKFKDKIDTTLGQAGYSAVNLGFTPGVPGAPVYKGRIGTVELYVYNDTYEDVDGTIKQLIPDWTVIIAAPGAFDGVPTYGAILDPRAGYVPVPMFAKNWIEEDPAAEWVMTQSGMLMVPKRVNASMAITVNG